MLPIEPSGAMSASVNARRPIRTCKVRSRPMVYGVHLSEAIFSSRVFTCHPSVERQRHGAMGSNSELASCNDSAKAPTHLSASVECVVPVTQSAGTHYAEYGVARMKLLSDSEPHAVVAIREAKRYSVPSRTPTLAR